MTIRSVFRPERRRRRSDRSMVSSLSRAACFTLVPMIAALANCGGRNARFAWPDPASVEDVRILSVDSIGAEYGDSFYVFGSIADVDIAPNGNILVLDNIYCHIRVFSPQGEFIEQIGRYGSGPGEMLGPAFLVCLDNGNICVWDNSGWIRYAENGDYICTDPILGARPMQMVSSGSGSIVGIRSALGIHGQQLVVEKSIACWREDTPDSLDVVFFEAEHELRQSHFAEDLVGTDLFPMLFAAGNGRVYIAPDPQEEPLVLVFSADGTPLDTLFLPYSEVHKTTQEIEEEKDYIESFFQRTTQTMQVEWEPHTFRPMIKSLGIGEGGNLWIQRGSELTPTFDVLAPDGQLLFTAVLPDRLDASDWRFKVSTGGILAVPMDPPSDLVLYLIDQG